jgi:hypothetical protein
MAVSAELFEYVRQRSALACEYCGIHENDAGGPLTIDHYHPLRYGGTDDLDNLLYACFRCNSYKGGYWPGESGETPLWNPRAQPAADHFIELDGGRLLALSEVGRLTVVRLRLNRPQLVEHRQSERRAGTRIGLVARLAEILDRVTRGELDRSESAQDRRALLEEQRQILEALKKLG